MNGSCSKDTSIASRSPLSRPILVSMRLTNDTLTDQIVFTDSLRFPCSRFHEQLQEKCSAANPTCLPISTITLELDRSVASKQTARGVSDGSRIFFATQQMYIDDKQEMSPVVERGGLWIPSVTKAGASIQEVSRLFSLRAPGWSAMWTMNQCFLSIPMASFLVYSA